MTPAPKWLSEYLEEKLPELAPLVSHSPDSPDAVAIHRWFDRLIEHFNSRGLVTPYQQRNRLVDARNAIKTRFGQDHPAFTIVNFSKETWWAINNHTAANPRTPKNTADDMKPTAIASPSLSPEAQEAASLSDTDLETRLQGAVQRYQAAYPVEADASEAAKPTVAEIQAKLTQAKERRATLKSTYDAERSQLAKQHQRLVEIKAKAEGKPVPVAAPAPAPTPAPAADPVEPVTPAVATTAQPEKKAKGPGLLSRLGSALKGLLSRRGKAGVPPAPAAASDTDDEAEAESKGTPVSAEAKGKAPAVTTPAAATALLAGAGAPSEGKALADQLNEVMLKIQAIQERLNKMEEQIRELDQQILGLEAELHEAELREADIKEGEARVSGAGEFYESREGEAVPTVPVTPAAGVAPQTNIGKAELTQVEETARRELANELRQGENVVLKGDYARLVRLDPDSYRVTDCGCDVVDGEAVPIFKLDAVLDPDMKEWVEAQQQQSEVVMEDESAAVAPEATVRKGRGR